jgi:cytochrome c5
MAVRKRQSTEFGGSLVGLLGVVVLVGLVYALTVSQFAVGPGAGTRQEIAARLAPVATVRIASEAPAGPAGALAPGAPKTGQTAASGAESIGQARFEKTCSACHATGVAGAPKLGDRAAWAPRIAKGIDALLQSAINGKNAMPPRGTCVSCSDAELKAAIEYMLSKAR